LYSPYGWLFIVVSSRLLTALTVSAALNNSSRHVATVSRAVVADAEDQQSGPDVRTSRDSRKQHGSGRRTPPTGYEYWEISDAGYEPTHRDTSSDETLYLGIYTDVH